MAVYMKEIFQGASPSEGAPADEGGLPLDVRVRDDSEELNFDRRAPLSLRFEAAPPEDAQPASRYPAPIPMEDAPGSARAGTAAPTVSLRPAPAGAASLSPTLAGGPANALPPADAKKKNGVGPASVQSPAPAAAAEEEASPERAAPARLAGTAHEALEEARKEARKEPTKPAQSRRGWLILLVLLLGAAALAFVGTR
jgi:hypothetical protein